jgi:hypothetical protein
LKSVVLRVLLGASLIGSGLVATSPSAAACAMEYITPTTLHVEIGPFKKTYRKEDVVKVQVTVSRPAEEDPVGLGIGFERPVSEPAPEVNVGVGISLGRVFLPGYGFTNEQGKTVVPIRIERYAPAKTAYVRAYAYKTQLETTCLTVEEQGYRTVPDAFKVTD